MNEKIDIVERFGGGDHFREVISVDKLSTILGNIILALANLEDRLKKLEEAR